jgi:5-methyltetrahydrofolate--homocysteine methyltransferase
VIDMGVMVPADKILDTAVKENVDVIGLSGLITPSLDEMVHVAAEMQRQGFTIPLLIGGATTSKAHTAVKIAPAYAPPVVHVLDASRAVGVVGALRSPEQRQAFDAKNREEQEKQRLQHRAKTDKPMLGLDEARRRRTPIDWSGYEPEVPPFTGVRSIADWPIAELIPYIDWSPFFHTWELRGTYPRIFENPDWGARAREVFDDAQRMLERVVSEKLLTASAAWGFFPANAVGDDVELYADSSRHSVRATLHTLRQQTDRPADQPLQALADFVAPRESGHVDHVGAFVVTAGRGIERELAVLAKDHDDYGSIMLKALADRLAEAAAEALHHRVRREWYAADENIPVSELNREQYRGIRPAPGYPACPDHSEKRTLFALLEAETRAGVSLTESFAMMPAASVSGFYFSHPQARYFQVGLLGRDQVVDYARRKGVPLSQAERWLSPVLSYEASSTPAAETSPAEIVAGG